jgi:hypothetical protein
MGFALILLALQTQDVPSDHIRAKQVIQAARTRASRWDPNSIFIGFAVLPYNDIVYDSGRAEGWTFSYASRKNCTPGKIKIANITVRMDSKRFPSETVINGFGVNFAEGAEIDAPFSTKADDDWMDSDRAFTAFKKNGIPKASGIKILEVRWFYGKTLWKGVGDSLVVYLDSGGKVVAKGQEIELDLLQKYAKAAPIDDVAERVVKDWAAWKDGGAAKIVSMDALALDAASFVKDPKIHRALVTFVVEKPEPRKYVVRVVNDRVEYFEPGTIKDMTKEGYDKTVSWPLDKLGKPKDALAAHAPLKEWLEKHPKARVRVRTLESRLELLFHQEPDELVLQYDPATGKVE